MSVVLIAFYVLGVCGAAHPARHRPRRGEYAGKLWLRLQKYKKRDVTPKLPPLFFSRTASRHAALPRLPTPQPGAPTPKSTRTTARRTRPMPCEIRQRAGILQMLNNVKQGYFRPSVQPSDSQRFTPPAVLHSNIGHITTRKAPNHDLIWWFSQHEKAHFAKPKPYKRISIATTPPH